MATHINKLLVDFFKKQTILNNQKEKIQNIVSRELPPSLTPYISITKLSTKSIFFKCDYPSVKYELNLLKEKLLSKITKEFPKITHIKIY